jgi:hypothetical protein
MVSEHNIINHAPRKNSIESRELAEEMAYAEHPYHELAATALGYGLQDEHKNYLSEAGEAGMEAGRRYIYSLRRQLNDPKPFSAELEVGREFYPGVMVSKEDFYEYARLAKVASSNSVQQQHKLAGQLWGLLCSSYRLNLAYESRDSGAIGLYDEQTHYNWESYLPYLESGGHTRPTLGRELSPGTDGQVLPTEFTFDSIVGVVEGYRNKYGTDHKKMNSAFLGYPLYGDHKCCGHRTGAGPMALKLLYGFVDWKKQELDKVSSENQ